MVKKYSLIILLLMLAVFFLIPCAVSAQSDDQDAAETETEEIDEDLVPDEETLLSWPFSEDSGEINDFYTSSLDPDGTVWAENEDGAVSFVSGNEFGAIAAARDLGIREDMAVEYEADCEGTEINFMAVSNAIGSIRKSKTLDASWKTDIETYRAKKK